MTIELIYDRDCPNAVKARTHLAEALAAFGREAQWTEWDRGAPESPARIRDYGSPTILINGEDVAGKAAGEAGPFCRLYRNAADRFDGAPPVEQIVAALSARVGAPGEAAPGRREVFRNHNGRFTMKEQNDQEKAGRAYAAPIIAIISAIASLACCLPLALLAALGAAGASAVFAALRPWLLLLCAAMLVIGFWQLYRPRTCRRRSIGSVTLFWLAAVIFLAMLFFPQVVASILAGRIPS